MKVEHVVSPEGVITLTITPPSTLSKPLLCRDGIDPRPETARELVAQVLKVWATESLAGDALEEALLPFVCWAQPAHEIREREAQARAILWAAGCSRSEGLAESVRTGKIKVP